MTVDADDIDYVGDVAVNNGAPYKNAIPAIRALYAIFQNLNIPDSQTADEIATALAADSSAMATLQDAIEKLEDVFHGRSNMFIPFTFEDKDDWVTSAAGDPTSSLTTISASDLEDDATFGPEWEQDSQTSAVTVYQRIAFRPRPGRVYRVTVKGYVGGSNSSTLQAVVAQLNSSYAVTTANKASTQNTTFTAANTLQTVTFTMSIDNGDADVDLDAVPFIRVGATIGPDTATSTNCRITEIHLEDVTEPFTNLDATAIVSAITGSASDLESLKDAIVTDFDANDMQAIVADIDADATSEQNLASALAGNATAMSALGAAFSGDIDAGAFSAGAVDTADLAADAVETAKIANDAVTLAKIADAALSGSDATLITGTAGTDGNLAQWNADGDLVDGPDVLDEDDMSSDSATAVPTQQSVKAYVDNSSEVSSFTSSAQTITAAGLLTVAHGLGAAPDLLQFRLRCTDASGELGWSQNDETFISNDAADAATNTGIAAYVDSTNVYVRFATGASTFYVLNKGSGSKAAAITNSKWALLIDAWVFS